MHYGWIKIFWKHWSLYKHIFWFWVWILQWHQSLDLDCPQVKTCIKIALLCVDNDQRKRPTIRNIIEMLNGKETMIEMASTVNGNSRNNSGPSIKKVLSPSKKLIVFTRLGIVLSQIFLYLINTSLYNLFKIKNICYDSWLHDKLINIIFTLLIFMICFAIHS